MEGWMDWDRNPRSSEAQQHSGSTYHTVQSQFVFLDQWCPAVNDPTTSRLLHNQAVARRRHRSPWRHRFDAKTPFRRCMDRQAAGRSPQCSEHCLINLYELVKCDKNPEGPGQASFIMCFVHDGIRAVSRLPRILSTPL
ncbi:hypothetical protein E2C01_009927 [Portunus trituberculatus]|uniref:Uncharacterized protein n=1 Tax=Portunus trituberculatus TaxID=210409 RepID=A0A5B7D709_PORTR|nr:hypothetical protein [Portunus trituberculatus]